MTIEHVAVIMDGNRRWAKGKSITADSEVYEAGGEKTAEILEAGFKYGIKHISIWAGSRSNLINRSKSFVTALEDMYKSKIAELAKHKMIHEHGVRIDIAGEWRELLRPDVSAALQDAIDATQHYNERVLTILIGYDGQRERGAAVQSLMQSDEDIPTGLEDASELLRKHSWTGYLPEVDLVIRTGAWEDPHNSAGFMSLLTNESQYAFPKVLWPDYTAELLNDDLEDFQQRERRKGA